MLSSFLRDRSTPHDPKGCVLEFLFFDQDARLDGGNVIGTALQEDTEDDIDGWFIW
jgi:hypothetical protein